jgi:hypothetical protein
VEEFGVGITLEDPLLPLPLSLVFLFHPEEFCKLFF